MADTNAMPAPATGGSWPLERLAFGLAAFGPTDASGAMLDKTRLCVADFLASALTSQDLPWSRQAIAVARRHSDPEGAPILGTPHTAATDEAAFANAVLGHGLVRDDMHLGSVSHLGVCIVPTVLALAARAPVSGSALLAASIAGYEAGGRLGRAILDVDVARVFRPTGITGAFAAAAAAAHLRALDAERFTSALALAANAAAGYNEWAATGGTEMFFHPGLAVRNALLAVALAEQGAFCSPSAVDGPAGMLAAFAKASSEALASPFSGEAEVLAVFFKEVPACNFAQTAAQVARDLAVEEAHARHDIERVRVRVPYAAAHYPGCDRSAGFAHILQAKMSIQYNVASALLHGHFDEPNYEPSRQPEVLALAERVAIEIDPALTAAFPARQGAAIELELAGGRRRNAAADDVKPASDVLVLERLRAAAQARLGESRADALLEALDTLPTSRDAGEIGRLAQTP